MNQYTLFYSWQSDRKDVKNIIKEAIVNYIENDNKAGEAQIEDYIVTE